MKITRLLLFIGLLSTTALFTSCEKSYTCTCKIDDKFMKSSNMKSKSKKDATAACQKMQVHTNEECKLD